MFDNTKNAQSNGKKLQMKVLSKRESLLTELLTVKHFATIKHGFFSVLFGLLIRDLVCFLTNTRDVNFGLTVIEDAFRNIHAAIIVWFMMFILHLSIYLVFHCWAEHRRYLMDFAKPGIITLWDRIFLVSFILYGLGTLYIVPHVPNEYSNFGYATSCALVVENVRFIMKTHAFVRTNAAEVLKYKPHDDEISSLPTFSNYLYFSFAPTLVYRREYPRTKKVDMKKVIVYFCEVLLIIWLKSYIFNKFFMEPFQNVGKTKLDWGNIAVSIVEGSLGGGIIMLAAFYLFLHAWLNAFAELSRFADRKFYEDWWTSTNYSTYFRTWNIVVHDWLYEYIYKEFYYYLIPNRKSVAKIMVFLISAIIHEYIISNMVKHFLPIVFINFFLFGVAFTFLQTEQPVYNIFFLYSLALGNSIQFSFHAIESYAQLNCPYKENETISYFIPRFISMDCSS